MRKRAAQSVLEYTVIITCVAAALVGMFTYMKRGVHGAVKSAFQGVGEQFDPFDTTSQITTKDTGKQLSVSYLWRANLDNDPALEYASESVAIFDKDTAIALFGDTDPIVEELDTPPQTIKTGYREVGALAGKELFEHVRGAQQEGVVPSVPTVPVPTPPVPVTPLPQEPPQVVSPIAVEAIPDENTSSDDEEETIPLRVNFGVIAGAVSKEAVITVDSNRTLSCVMSVFDMNGTFVKEVYPGGLNLPAGKEQLIWDLSDVSGNRVERGLYTVEIAYQDAASGFSAEDATRFSALVQVN